MTHEAIIDSFIDGERIDQTALDAALASADGRAYLMDMLALRALVRAEDAPAAVTASARPRVLRFAIAAAAAIALAAGGYAAGARSAEADALSAAAATSVENAPPEPTQVIELKPGVNWHETKGGD